MCNLGWWGKACAVLAVCAATGIAAHAQTFTTLVGFGGSDGATPGLVTLVQGTDGGLYGTTDNLGDGPGTVFRLGTNGTLTTVYKFCSLPNCADGDLPISGVIVGTDGNLYGVTYEGGANDYGTVFRLTLSGSLTTLYSFCNLTGCTDGRNPYGGLVEGSDGNLYGTTAAGGTSEGGTGAGTIFKITSAGLLKTLYTFCPQGGLCSDGASPQAALTEGADGSFYGSTFGGGGQNHFGTLFKITPGGVFTSLWNFDQSGGGSKPIAPLIQLGDGGFYGTTTGDPNGYGTIFRVTRTGKLGVQYMFCNQRTCSDGRDPNAPLASGTDGNLYGTTAEGGNPNCPLGCGTIFQASKEKFTTLYSFCPQNGCADGYEPLGGLTQATNGVFYGTTWLGGVGGGTAFSLNMGLGPFVTFVRAAGKVGQTGPILGQGFTGTTSVSLNGIPASFKVVSDTFIEATVPAGASTGYVTVTTPSGTLSSNVPFHVIK
ncbi:MAG: choice-of-anchor tandem repeat GloVer-containing protein [Terriglobales bacterium]